MESINCVRLSPQPKRFGESSMIEINREVRVFVLIGGVFLLAFALAYATTSLPSTHESKSERVAASSIERISLTNTDFRAELTTEGNSIVVGQPTSFIFNVKDSKGALVRDLLLVHQKPIHLILVSEDLAEFNHLHPEAQSDGSYRVNFTFPHGGAYRLYADFTPSNASQVVEQYKLTVSGPPVDRVTLTEDQAFTKSLGGLRAGEALLLEFTVADEATGKPVTDLQPYLGSLAHFVIITEDTSRYLHVHPMEGGASSGMNDEGMVGKMDEQMDAGPMPKPKPVSNVTVSAHTTFPDPGLYKLWAQFQRAGKVVTVPFVLRVNPSLAAAAKSDAVNSVPSDAIKVTVSAKGFQPARIEVKQNQKVKLAFYRADAQNCASEIAFPSLGIRKPLPPGQTTVIEITPKDSGALTFACGMGMLRGTLVVSQ